MHDQRLLVLESFGLSGYLARAYVALLDLGPAQARDVAERSSVPQGRIYDVLEKLHARGLIELLPEAPKRYRALPFEAFIDRELGFHQERATLLQRQRDEILQTMQPRDQVRQEVAEYLVLRGRRAVQERIATLTAGSTDVLTAGTESTGLRLGLYEDALREAKARGARHRVLLTITKANRAAVEQAASWGLEIRHREVAPPMTVSVFDGARALFYRTAAEVAPKGADASAILLEEPDLALGLRDLVERQWSRAATLEERLRELETGRKAGEVTTFRRTADAAPVLAGGRDRLQRELRAAVPVDLLGLLVSDPENTVRALVQRRVRVRLLLGVTAPEQYAQVERLLATGAEIRLGQPQEPLAHLLHDEAEGFVMLAELARRAQRGQAAAELITWSDGADFVASLGYGFEASWAAATPADKAREPATRRLPPA